MFKNATYKLSISLLFAFIFGGLSYLLARGPGNLLAMPDLALLAALLASVALLLGAYFVCELKSSKLLLFLLGTTGLLLPLAAAACFVACA